MKRIYLSARVIALVSVVILSFNGCDPDPNDDTNKTKDAEVLNISNLEGLTEIGDRVLTMESSFDGEIYLEYSTVNYFNSNRLTPDNFYTLAKEKNGKKVAYLPTKKSIQTFAEDRCKDTNTLPSICILNEYGDIDNLLKASHAHIFKDNEIVYYRWLYKTGSSYKVGDTHKAIIPRTLVFANVGDSFGSGEGAGAMVNIFRYDFSSPDSEYNFGIWNMPIVSNVPTADLNISRLGWYSDHDNNGQECHRAYASGQARILRAIRDKYPHYAYDYINVACSGATLKNVFDKAQKGKQLEPQLELVVKEMKQKKYSTLDGLILSGGGNDVGFSDMLVQYLGLTIKTSTLFGLIEGESHLLPREFSYTQPYGPLKWNWETHSIDKSEWKTFSEHIVSLKEIFQNTSEFIDLNNSLNTNMIFVSEYPNLLNKCNNGYSETMKLTSFYDDDSWYESAGEFLFDIFAQNPTIELDISKKEASDISTHIAPLATSGKGLNHTLKALTIEADSNVDKKWIYANNIASNHKQGLCEPLKDFEGTVHAFRNYNTFWDGYLLGGRKLNKADIANAFHPNVYGHKKIYFENLKKSIFNILNGNYLKKTYERENAHKNPDLILDEKETKIREIVTTKPFSEFNKIEVNTTIKNIGIREASDHWIQYNLYNKDKEITLAKEKITGGLSGRDIDDIRASPLRHQNGIYTIPENNIFNFSKFSQYEPNKSYEGNEERNAKVLSWNFPREFTVKLKVDANREISELNENNNILNSKEIILIKPLVSKEDIEATFTDLASSCSQFINVTRFRLDTPIDEATFTHETNTYSKCIRQFFKLESAPTLTAPPSILTTKEIEVILQHERLEEIRNKIKTKDERICLAVGRGAVQGVTKQCINEGETFNMEYLNLPQDGRKVKALLFAESDTYMQNSIAKEIQTPLNFARVKNITSKTTINYDNPKVIYNQGVYDLQTSVLPKEKLTSDIVNISWIEGKQEALAQSISIGTRRGGKDIFVSKLENGQPITVKDIPQDGRYIYITLYTKTTNNQWYKSESIYQTSKTNSSLEDISFYKDGKMRLEFTEKDVSKVELGSSKFKNDFRIKSRPTGKSTELSNLPQDGRLVYLTLTSGNGNKESYFIKLADQYPGITTPRNNNKLKRNQTFRWNKNLGDIQHFELKIGRDKGMDNFYKNTNISASDKSTLILKLIDFIPIMTMEQNIHVEFTTVLNDGTRHSEFYQYRY